MNESKQVQQSNRANSPNRQQVHRATPSADPYTTALMAARYPSEQMLRMVGIGGYSSLGPGVSMANLNHLPPQLYTQVSQPNFLYPPRDGQYPPRWSPRETPEYAVQSSMDSRAPDPYSPVAVPYFRFNRDVQREFNREAALDHLATAMSGVSHHQTPSSQAARRRPSLLPPPPADYPYPPGVYPRSDGQERYVLLPLATQVHSSESISFFFLHQVSSRCIFISYLLRSK